MQEPRLMGVVVFRAGDDDDRIGDLFLGNMCPKHDKTH